MCGPMMERVSAWIQTRLLLAQAFPGSLRLGPTSLYSALGWAKEFTVHLLPLVPPVVASCLSVSKHSSGCVATLLCVIRCLTDEPPGPVARNDTSVTARLRSSPDRALCSSGTRAPTLMLYVLMTKATDDCTANATTRCPLSARLLET